MLSAMMRTRLRAHLKDGTPDSTELGRDRLDSKDIAYLKYDTARCANRMLAPSPTVRLCFDTHTIAVAPVKYPGMIHLQ